jgi:hypothetical protein
VPSRAAHALQTTASSDTHTALGLSAQGRTWTHTFEILQHRAAHWTQAVLFGGQQGLVWNTLTAQRLWKLSIGWRTS